ncbi:MAG: DNA mismatch repair protein MutS [Geobacter sp.]|nr:DNA mismatch repair protein MutS [Geobacter sp.]
MTRKKGKTVKAKAKEFSARPFSAIKGLQVEQAAPPAPAPLVPAKGVEKSELDDDALFLREMAGLKRVRPAGTGEMERRKAPAPDGPVSPQVPVEERRLFLDTVKSLKLDVRFSDELPPGEKGGRRVAVNRLRQLQRGLIRIDLELDLHGLTREEALQSLAAFIGGAYRRGQQAVLVITGKGNNSPAEPVLLTAVAGWLREQGKGMVAEFAPAPRQLGGEGAYVVFLKAVKKEA